jgi:hypothetical protein
LEYPSGLLGTPVQRMVAFIDVMKRVRMPVDWNALSNVYFPPVSLLRGRNQAELVAGLAIVSLPSR